MELFTESGFLNIDKIEQNPFIVMVGARRTGKTYGTLKKMLKEDRKFIYMRRTGAEIEFSAQDETNPFRAFLPEYNIVCERSSKYSFRFGDETEHGIETRGLMIALTSVAKMRGFDGSEFTDIVYDEFIPERHVARIKAEGDALLNAYETINSNRELNGREPVRLWLLANSNNLNNEILMALGIREKMEQMTRKGQQYSVLRDRGITIVNICDSPISKAKRETALYKAVSSSGKFASMALENSFSYNDFSNIMSLNITEFIPRCRIGKYTVLDHKSDGRVFITDAKISCSSVYPMIDSGIRAFRIANGDLIFSYMAGELWFNSYETKAEMSNVCQFLENT